MIDRGAALYRRAEYVGLLLMPRQVRMAAGGMACRVLNRAVARLLLFENPADYDAFERVLVDARQRRSIRPPIDKSHWTAYEDGECQVCA